MDERPPRWAYTPAPVDLEPLSSFVTAFPRAVATSAHFVTQPLAISTVGIVLALAPTGCDQSPPEPAPRKTEAPAPAPAPSLAFTAPPTWSLDKAATQGTYRAKYTIPTAGDAKHPATLLVQNLGRGPKAAEEALDQLTRDFEGPKGEDGKASRPGVKRATLDRAAHPTSTLEVRGTYRFPLGPRRRGRAAAEVLKENWVALAAVVTAPDGTRWLFRVVGPADTVDGARSAFQSMVAAAR